MTNLVNFQFDPSKGFSFCRNANPCQNKTTKIGNSILNDKNKTVDFNRKRSRSGSESEDSVSDTESVKSKRPECFEGMGTLRRLTEMEELLLRLDLRSLNTEDSSPDIEKQAKKIVCLEKPDFGHVNDDESPLEF